MATIIDHQHNRPPADADPLADRLADDYAGMVDRTTELENALGRAPAAVTEENIDRVNAYIAQLGEHAKQLEKTREGEKADYLRAGRTVDGFFKKLAERIDKPKRIMQERLRVFLTAKADAERKIREEQARREREEQERLEAEARELEERLATAAREAEEARQAALAADPAHQAALAAAAAKAEQDAIDRAIAAQEAAERQRATAEAAQRQAEAKTADLARTRGAIGGTASLATVIDFEIEDPTKAIAGVANLIEPGAIERAIRAYMRTFRGADIRDSLVKGQPLDGVRFYIRHAARVT